MAIALHLKGPQDRNGNPRRCFLVVEEKRIAAVIDEGYKGRAALDRRFEECPVLAEINVTAREYNEWRRSPLWEES